jgi:hypothetical protein
MDPQYRIEKVDPTKWSGKSPTFYPQYSYRSFFLRKLKWAYFTRQELEEVGGQLHFYTDVKKFDSLEKAREFLDDMAEQKKRPVTTIIDYP